MSGMSAVMLGKVLSICYEPKFVHPRHAALKEAGFVVDSVLGNKGAMNLPTLNHDIVVICHAAPLEVRQQMMDWIRKRSPNARVVALYSDVETDRLQRADAEANGIEPHEIVQAVVQCLSAQYGSIVA